MSRNLAIREFTNSLREISAFLNVSVVVHGADTWIVY